MLTQLLVVANSLLLPYFYTGIRQNINQIQQYGNDLQVMKGMSFDLASTKTGDFFQANNILLIYLIIILLILFSQFTYLQYIISKSFRLDKNWLIAGSILCFSLSLSLPLLLFFSWFYHPQFIGNLLLIKQEENKLSEFLTVNFNSILTYLSAAYIFGNIIYLLIFNKVHYICVKKIT